MTVDEPAAPDPSDDAVLTASLTDPERFAVLFDRHAPAVHRYLARRIGGALADDLLSETFLVAFRRCADYRVEHIEARPWLFGIAGNLLRRHGRDEERRYRALARIPVEAPEGLDFDGIADRVDAERLRAALAAALADLPAADREPLLLAAWAELTYPQIAAALGIPIGTVRSRLHRARARVRAAVGPDWLDSEES